MNNDIQINEPALLIRISKLFNTAMTENKLYEATRRVWKIGKNREKAQYAFSVAHGLIQEVYEIFTWMPAGTAEYQTRLKQDVEIEGRWEFTGKKADDYLRARYIGKSLSHYFPKGASNPITYVNC